MRTGNKGVPTETGAKKIEERRILKAKVINKEEKVMKLLLLSEIEERGWIIINKGERRDLEKIRRKGKKCNYEGKEENNTMRRKKLTQ